jgi:hypothetical protein
MKLGDETMNTDECGILYSKADIKALLGLSTV